MHQIYLETSPTTLISEYEEELKSLSANAADICIFVQNVLIHAYWLDHYQVSIPEPEKLNDMQLRSSAEIIAKALQRPPYQLALPRLAKDRVVSICRDFSVLSCAIFRFKGIPARVRCGFATYLTPDQFEDHWLCEYWHEQENRWVGVDAQLDDVHRRILKFNFDPLDVPSSAFLSAGEAWQQCRTSNANADLFGIKQFHGLAFIKGNIIRDLYALSGIELLAWDTGWGLIPNYMSGIENEAEYDFLDQLADISQRADTERAVSIVKTHPQVKFPDAWQMTQCPTLSELMTALDA